MKLYLCPNVYTDDQKKRALDCFDTLERMGHECSVSVAVSLELFGHQTRSIFQPGDCDMIVSLGGDGAVLRAAKQAVATEKPLVGINSGRLGYMCAVEYTELALFDQIIGDHPVSERTLIEARTGERRILAINDIIVTGWKMGSSADLYVQIQGMEPYRIRGDGILIATPTGSTAYNLSAGGPVLDPESQCNVVTPICVHSGYRYPVVIGQNKTITVHEYKDAVRIFADGDEIENIDGKIVISTAQEKLKLVAKRIPTESLALSEFGFFQ